MIATAGIAVGAWNASRQAARLLEEFRTTAARCAVAFETEDIAALLGSPADVGSREYRAVKQRLQRLRAIEEEVRFVYLFRATDAPGEVVFLADSEPEGAPDESKPGDPYPEARTSPGLQSVLRDGRPATEGPLRDSFGNWVTAYASVGQPAPGMPRVVLGLDLSAAEWTATLWREGLIGATYMWLVLGLPFFGWVVLQRERHLNRAIVRFSEAIQQSHSGILITDLERRIDYANAGAALATGYAIEELVNQPARMLLPGQVDDALRQRIVDLVLGGERWQGELSVRRKNGEVFPARAVISPVRDPRGRVTSLVMVFDDVTDVKNSEEALRVARDQAESADRAKGEFLAVMSHELRTPLNGIIGFAMLLQDTPLSTEQKDYADTIRQSGEALLTLTNELLDYSRIDAGRMQLDPQPCSPRQIVEEAVELLSARAAEKQLELIATVSPAVPASVVADPGRLRQVIVNLVGNAIKFTPAGEVEVTLEAAPLPPGSDGPQARLEFTVRDTGIGIAHEQQARLFQPFSQVDASTTRKHGGAGLGLAISRSLVRLMGGDIDVSSSAGAGSVFRFHVVVPVLEAPQALPALPARRVALVSANVRARRHYAALLQSWGLEVELHETLATVAEAPPSDLLLVVDVLARDAAAWPDWLRTQPALEQRPVVGLVPVSVPPAVRDRLRQAFRTLLKKPMREPLFHAVLQSLLKSGG